LSCFFSTWTLFAECWCKGTDKKTAAEAHFHRRPVLRVLCSVLPICGHLLRVFADFLRVFASFLRVFSFEVSAAPVLGALFYYLLFFESVGDDGTCGV
jgi:hypothetical protein